MVKQFRATHYLTVPPYATTRRSPAKRLAITDEASPFALRSTRNHPRTALHQRCQLLLAEGKLERCHRGVMACHRTGRARNLPETTPHVTSRRPTAQPSAAPLTRVVVWVREVLRGVVNSPSINGMQGVRGSNPLSSTRHNASTALPLGVVCQEIVSKSLVVTAGTLSALAGSRDLRRSEPCLPICADPPTGA
jgi:hypothetical protein